MNKLRITQNKTGAFTLVELIVVIVILAILATIAFLSFSSQSSSVRDSTRLSDMSNISKGLSVFNATSGSYPTPDNPVTISASGITIGKQGYAGSSVLNMVKISNGGKDPLDNSTYYTYSINANNSKFQILGFLEDGSNVSLSMNPGFLSKPGLEWANADPASYSGRYVITKGDQLGILLNSTTLVPIQSANNPVDLAKAQASATYKAIFGNENSGNNMTASGASVFSSIYNKNTDLINNKTLASMDDSLVGYWDMETLTTDGSKLKDLSKYGNDGTLNGGIIIGGVNGKKGKSTSFDGSNDYINAGNNIILHPNVSQLTISLWVKWSGANQIGGLVVKGDTSTRPYSLYTDFRGAFKRFTLCKWKTGTFDTSNINYDFTPNNWVYVTLAYNDKGGVLYTNGVPIDNQTWAELGFGPDNSANVMIGNIGGNFFSGSIDEVKIYNRTLSSTEIQTQYNSTK